MTQQDQTRFLEILNTMAELYERELSDAQARLWFKLLQHIEIEVFERTAMHYMRSDAAFMPKPGQILTMISENDGRPGAEEAWGLIEFDEAATLIMTEEMFTAFSAALPLEDDKIAARMAFKESYVRAVADARAQERPVKWRVSLGHDPDQREHAIFKALEQGRLLPYQARTHLAHLTDEEIQSRMVLPQQTMAGLLEKQPKPDAA